MELPLHCPPSGKQQNAFPPSLTLLSGNHFFLLSEAPVASHLVRTDWKKESSMASPARHGWWRGY